MTTLESIRHVLATALEGAATENTEAMAKVCGAAASAVASSYEMDANCSADAWKAMTCAEPVGSRWIAFRDGWRGK